jgi:histidinol phosphatase-like enzyme (inositol monophosphatase family)
LAQPFSVFRRQEGELAQSNKFSSSLARELLAVAHELADAARPIALQYFRKGGQNVENKLEATFDPVTLADRQIEARMREILAVRRPEDGILGEEYGTRTGSSGLIWVLDPIDGTRSFISGTPTWGVLIAVGAEDGPQIGLIDQPFTGERFVGAPGVAQWHRGADSAPNRVRSCSALGEATLFSTYPEVGSSAECGAFERVRAQVKLTRFGTDCYAYGLLAAGQIDLVIEAGLEAYDIQGPMAVIQAAGGLVTNWQGGPAHQGGQVIAAGDARMHKAAIAALNAG